MRKEYQKLLDKLKQKQNIDKKTLELWELFKRLILNQNNKMESLAQSGLPNHSHCIDCSHGYHEYEIHYQNNNNQSFRDLKRDLNYLEKKKKKITNGFKKYDFTIFNKNRKNLRFEPYKELVDLLNKCPEIETKNIKEQKRN